MSVEVTRLTQGEVYTQPITPKFSVSLVDPFENERTERAKELAGEENKARKKNKKKGKQRAALTADVTGVEELLASSSAATHSPPVEAPSTASSATDNAPQSEHPPRHDNPPIHAEGGRVSKGTERSRPKARKAKKRQLTENAREELIQRVDRLPQGERVMEIERINALSAEGIATENIRALVEAASLEAGHIDIIQAPATETSAITRTPSPVPESQTPSPELLGDVNFLEPYLGQEPLLPLPVPQPLVDPLTYEHSQQNVGPSINFPFPFEANVDGTPSVPLLPLDSVDDMPSLPLLPLDSVEIQPRRPSTSSLGTTTITQPSGDVGSMPATSVEVSHCETSPTAFLTTTVSPNTLPVLIDQLVPSSAPQWLCNHADNFLKEDVCEDDKTCWTELLGDWIAFEEAMDFASTVRHPSLCPNTH